MRSPKTPQQKKALSYVKDRRNIYGESSQASRKGIRFQKRRVNQTYRTTVKSLLKDVGVVGSLQNEAEQDRLTRVEGCIDSHQRIDWKKSPDIPLSDYVAIKKHRRIVRTNRRKPRLN